MNAQGSAGDSAEQKARSPMWDLLKEEDAYRRPKRGDILEAEVVRIDPDAIIVDIGSKTEGVIPSSELEKLDPATRAEISLGAKMSVYVVHPEGPEGDVIVSLDMARSAQQWHEAERYQAESLLYEGTVSGYNKGGLIIPFGGIRGFLPGSQLSDPASRSDPEERERYLASRVGQRLALKVIEVDRRRRRLIFSERAAAKEAREARKEQLLGELEEGHIRRGRVSSLADFGAFVDLGGADGLIHISELSWQRVEHPREVLQVGQEVDVYVLRVDRERKRIGLSLRRLRPDPWQEVEESFRVGQIVEGAITHVVEFGAFARIAEGIEGLIHVSELGEVAIKEGENWPLKIISIDAPRQRIGLSLKQAPGREEWEGLAAYREMASAAVVPSLIPSPEPLAEASLTSESPPQAELLAEEPEAIQVQEALTPALSEAEVVPSFIPSPEPLAEVSMTSESPPRAELLAEEPEAIQVQEALTSALSEAAGPQPLEVGAPQPIQETAAEIREVGPKSAPPKASVKRATRTRAKTPKTTSPKTGRPKSTRKKSKL